MKLYRIMTAISCAACSSLAIAQQPAAGSALAEQLAESSLRMIGSMAAVLALVAVSAWCLRRWRDTRGANAGGIEIVSGLTLGSKERIVLLQVGDEQVLVGVSPAGMRSLHVVSQPPASAAEHASRNADQDDAVTAVDRSPAQPFSLSLGAAQ